MGSPIARGVWPKIEIAILDQGFHLPPTIGTNLHTTPCLWHRYNVLTLHIPIQVQFDRNDVTVGAFCLLRCRRNVLILLSVARAYTSVQGEVYHLIRHFDWFEGSIVQRVVRCAFVDPDGLVVVGRRNNNSCLVALAVLDESVSIELYSSWVKMSYAGGDDKEDIRGRTR